MTGRPAFAMPVAPAQVRRPTPLPARESDIAFFVPGEAEPKGELKGSCVRHPLVKLRHSNDKAQKEWRAQILRELDRHGLRPAVPHDAPVIIWICFVRPPLVRRDPWWPLWHTKDDGDKLERCVWDVFTKAVWYDDGRVHRWAGEKWDPLDQETPGAHIRIWLLTPDDLAAERARLEIR